MSIMPSRAAPSLPGMPPFELPVPQPADNRAEQLAALRAELDGIDDALHDLLMQRAELVVRVGTVGAKGRMPLRPGREASILRRLLGRNRGALAPDTLVRVWREVLAGSSAQQNALRVVVGDAALWPVVQEHFGARMAAEAVAPEAALAQVRDGRASVAVLALPSDAADWWKPLAGDPAPGVHVVARLPFWQRGDGMEAVVLSAAEPDPSGRDRSLLAGDPAALARVGLPARDTLARDGAAALVEVDGFVTAADPRLREAPAAVLGAYAVQMAAGQIGAGQMGGIAEGVDR